MQSKVAIFKPEEGVFEIKNEQVKDSLSSNEVLIRQISISISDVDVVDGRIHKLTRLGHAAGGEVIKVGEGVTWLNAGDKVIYCAVPGAFCEYRVVDQAALVKVPDGITQSLATALLYRGCIAHMATARAFIVRGGVNALVDNIHNPTNAVIALFARQRGAFVIGITSENSEVPQDVCDVVIHSNSQDLEKDVMNATKNIGCHVYYTGLHSITFEKTVDCLTLSGVIVDHLNVIQNIQTALIAKKSLFFTSPSVIHYKSIRSELVLTVDEIMSIHSKTPFPLEISQHPFDQIDNAFAEASSQSNTKAVTLKF